MDQLPRLGKRELICLLLFTCNYVVFVWRGFLFLWLLGMGYVILLWNSLSLPYNYFSKTYKQEIRIFSNFEYNIIGQFLIQRCWIIMKIVSSDGHGCHFCRPPLISEIVGKFDLGL